MVRSFRARVLASSLLLGAASFALSCTPAIAQNADVSISFDTFHDRLAAYGDWVYSDRWGEVWIPSDVPDDFHPYGTDGHWADTDEYGWTWVSDYDWGDIPFHYGRWVNDPDDGWLWIPGYVWSPGWVVWRTGGQYTGWMPMPPDDQFLGRGNDNGANLGIAVGGGGLSFSIDFNNTDDYYGYSRWYGSDYNADRFAANWTFVNTGHIGDHDYRHYEAPRANYATIIHDGRNVTNYTIVNNYVVNKSVDVRDVERASGGRQIRPVHASAVFKHPQFVATVEIGRQTEMRVRAERPRGNGEAGSAPKPPPQVIQSLSPNVKAHNGKAPEHLFTRATVSTAPADKFAKPGENPMPPKTNEGNGPANGKPDSGADHGNDKTAHPGEMPNTNGANDHNNGEMKHDDHPGANTPAGAPATTTPTGGANDHGNNDHNNGGMKHDDHPGANMPNSGAGAASPTPDTSHHDHTGPAAGTEPPAGTPPATETPHHDHTGPAAGSEPATNAPAATPPATETPREHHERTAPAGGTEPSTNAPATGGVTPPATETPHEHPDHTGPAAGSEPTTHVPAGGGNTSPALETPHEHHEHTGPAAGSEPSATPATETPHHEHTAPAGTPPATQNKPGNPDAASHASGDNAKPSGAEGDHGDKKDKKHKPDEPGAPPQ